MRDGLPGGPDFAIDPPQPEAEQGHEHEGYEPHNAKQQSWQGNEGAWRLCRGLGRSPRILAFSLPSALPATLVISLLSELRSHPAR